MQTRLGYCGRYTGCNTHHRTSLVVTASAKHARSAEDKVDSCSRRAALLSACLLPLLGSAAATAVKAAEADLVLPMPPAQGAPPTVSPYSKVLRVPGEFLRARQRVNGGEKILAPIRASMQRLQEAEQIVQKINVYEPNRLLYRDALSTIRAASLNCYGFEAIDGDSIETRASLLQRNLRIGDACTFRLIAKNVTSIMPVSKKKLRKETSTQLEDLIKSYELLDTTLAAAWHGDTNAVEQVPQKLQFTIAHTTSFETVIERCLDLPPSNVAPSAISALSVERLRQSMGTWWDSRVG